MVVLGRKRSAFTSLEGGIAFDNSLKKFKRRSRTSNEENSDLLEYKGTIKVHSEGTGVNGGGIKKQELNNAAQNQTENKREKLSNLLLNFRQGGPENVLRTLDDIAEFLYQCLAGLPPHLKVGRQDKFQGLSGCFKFKKCKKKRESMKTDAISPLILRLAAPKKGKGNEEDNTEPNLKLGELELKLSVLKGKRASYREKLLKKKLKNKIKRKVQSEKRKLLKLESAADLPKIELNEKKQKDEMKEKNDSEMVFSKFDFSSDRIDQKQKGDAKQSLQKLEKTKEFMEKLISSGKEDKANEIMIKNKWKSAILKAEGVKIRDNEELLKKSIKKKAQMKAKSKKKWDERNEILKKKMNDAQVKRKGNLDQRKQQKKNVKIRRAVKKGRMLPS